MLNITIYKKSIEQHNKECKINNIKNDVKFNIEEITDLQSQVNDLSKIINEQDFTIKILTDQLKKQNTVLNNLVNNKTNVRVNEQTYRNYYGYDSRSLTDQYTDIYYK